ncbi:MAG: hypothetical protein WCF84_10415 [Anaerolineae bacterium]
MSAFLDFLNAYAIWVYLGGVIGILFCIKMLVDARRQARTTLFTLEQEQANDRALRAILFMVVFTLVIVSVSVINNFVAPVRAPTPSGALAQPTTLPYTPPVVLPTFTTVPTLTPQSPTEVSSATPTKGASSLPPPGPAQPTVAPAVAEPTATKSAAPAMAVTYPAPILVAPVDKEPISAGRIQFRWDTGNVPAQLPDGQSYRITVYYADRDSHQRIESTNCTIYSNIFTTNWLGNAQGRAADSLYWYVVVVQLPNPNASCIQGTPISPPSETHSFQWH